MAARSRRKAIERLTPSQYGLLRELSDEATLDAAALEGLVATLVQDRLVVAKGMLDAARVLAGHENVMVRRSAISRAYYGAYQAARATVFEVDHRDEDSHEDLPKAVDRVLSGNIAAGETLTELKRLRHETDYSPYPGPNAKTEYTTEELDELIQRAVRQAADMIDQLEMFLQNRRSER